MSEEQSSTHDIEDNMNFVEPEESEFCMENTVPAEKANVINNEASWEPNKTDAENEVLESNPQIRKIFVGNVPWKLSRFELRNFFRQFGKVMDCSIKRDKKKYSRHYGFVTFKNPEDAQRALSISPSELQRHWHNMFVSAADSRHQPQETSEGNVLWKKKKSYDNRESAQYFSSSNLLEARLQSEKDVKEDLCRIHILNDDCLMHIFSFLSQKERVKIERVCRRWQCVSRSTWLLQHHLSLTNMFPNRGVKTSMAQILRSLLTRCGPNLSSLDLSYRHDDYNDKVLTTIAKYAPNLHRLNLAGLPLMSYSLRYLSGVCAGLQYLNLEDCSGLDDRDLQGLFKKCPNLESLVLSRNNQFSGKCLRGLSKGKLSELALDDCNNLCSRFLVYGLQTLKHLTSLSLNSCINLTSTDIVEILQSARKVKTFSFGRYFPLLGHSALCSLRLLEDVVILDLQHNPAVNDLVAEVIAKNCTKLEYLNVTGCSVNHVSLGYASTLTNTGFHWISTLPNLVELKMSYSGVVSDQALDSLADCKKLKVLVCQGCPAFTDAGCMRIVAVCGDLEHFDFSGCDYVTNQTIETAFEAVKERTNNIKLKIIAGGTKVTVTEYRHPLLQVDLEDLCLSHLRPDYVDEVYFLTSDTDDASSDYENDDFYPSDCSSYQSDVDYYDNFGSAEDFEDVFSFFSHLN